MQACPGECTVCHPGMGRCQAQSYMKLDMCVGAHSAPQTRVSRQERGWSLPPPGRTARDGGDAGGGESTWTGQPAQPGPQLTACIAGAGPWAQSALARLSGHCVGHCTVSWLGRSPGQGQWVLGAARPVPPTWGGGIGTSARQGPAKGRPGEAGRRLPARQMGSGVSVWPGKAWAGLCGHLSPPTGMSRDRGAWVLVALQMPGHIQLSAGTKLLSEAQPCPQVFQSGLSG